MSAVALGVGRGSPMVSNSADWLLRDEFITDMAAGSVNGTAAEPGPGTRTVVDLGDGLYITGGKAIILPYNAWDNELLRYSNVSSAVAGRLLITRVKVGSTGEARLSFGNADAWSHGFLWPGLRTWSPMTFIGGQPVNNAWQGYALVTRAAGMFFFINAGYWRLLWLRTYTTTPETQTVDFCAASASIEVDYVRVPDILWLPTPIASDGFGSVFGTTDGLGHAEGVAGGIGAGGGGVTWSNVGGTWSVSGGKAINTAPSGLSQQMSVAQMSTADVFASAALTRAAGEVGLALSMDSASNPANGVLVYLDGTNCKIDKIVGGSTSNVRTTAVTYSAGARLVVTKTGTEYRVYYNDALVGAADTISDAGIVNNTLHGLFSTDASNALDDFTCYATGSGGEYAELNKWS